MVNGIINVYKEKGYTSTKQGEIISYGYAKEIELDK